MAKITTMSDTIEAHLIRNRLKKMKCRTETEKMNERVRDRVIETLRERERERVMAAGVQTFKHPVRCMMGLDWMGSVVGLGVPRGPISGNNISTRHSAGKAAPKCFLNPTSNHITASCQYSACLLIRGPESRTG